MKPFPTLILLALGVVTLAAPSFCAEPGLPPSALATPAPTADRSWSVVGTWDAIHNEWTGNLTLKKDGSLLKDDEAAGDWLLYTTPQGRVMLLLRWAGWPAEVLTMIDGNLFQDKIDKGNLRLNRQGTTASSTNEAWTPVGIWDGTHTAWSGPITLTPDGSVQSKSENLSGRWTLSTQGGGVLLSILWDRWSAEVIPMLETNEFYGRTYDTATLRMHRQPAATPNQKPSVSFGGGVETRTWHQGEPPVKLIRKEEGFCALTLVTGGFAGGGEAVKVSIGDDGYWYLGGQSMQEGVGAECIVVRYRNLASIGDRGEK